MSACFSWPEPRARAGGSSVGARTGPFGDAGDEDAGARAHVDEPLLPQLRRNLGGARTMMQVAWVELAEAKPRFSTSGEGRRSRRAPRTQDPPEFPASARESRTCLRAALHTTKSNVPSAKGSAIPDARLPHGDHAARADPYSTLTARERFNSSRSRAIIAPSAAPTSRTRVPGLKARRTNAVRARSPHPSTPRRRRHARSPPRSSRASPPHPTTGDRVRRVRALPCSPPPIEARAHRGEMYQVLGKSCARKSTAATTGTRMPATMPSATPTSNLTRCPAPERSAPPRFTTMKAITNPKKVPAHHTRLREELHHQVVRVEIGLHPALGIAIGVGDPKHPAPTPKRGRSLSMRAPSSRHRSVLGGFVPLRLAICVARLILLGNIWKMPMRSAAPSTPVTTRRRERHQSQTSMASNATTPPREPVTEIVPRSPRPARLRSAPKRARSAGGEQERAPTRSPGCGSVVGSVPGREPSAPRYLGEEVVARRRRAATSRRSSR